MRDFALFFFAGTLLCMDGVGYGDGLRTLECVAQSDMFGWVGLDNLTDRRESVDIEDDGEIGDDDIGA